jgi:hypothetical protein
LLFIQAFDYDLMTAISVYMDVNNNPAEITAQRSSSSIHQRSSSSSSILRRSQRSNIDTHIPASSSTAAASSSSAHTSRTFRSINSPVINDIDGDSHDNLGQPVPPSNRDALMQKPIQELIRHSISSSSTTATDLDAAFQSFMYASTMNSSSSSGGGTAISDHFRHLLSSQHDIDNANDDDDHHHHYVSSTTRNQDVYDENGIRLPDPVQRQQLLGGGDDPLSFLSRSHHHHRSRSHGSHGHDDDDENDDDDDEMMVFARADDPSVDWMFPTPRHISYQRSFEEV